MKIVIRLQGTAPLIMHNIRLADPLDPIARQMKAVSAKKKKTDEDLLQLAQLEFAGGLYISDLLGPFIPGGNLEKSIVEGGRVTRNGKQVERGLLITDNEIPLIYNGPRTADELWADTSYRSRMAVKVGTSRVQRTRPIFRTWELEAYAELDTTELNLDTMRAIAADAGMKVGLGDYRPRYGRFTTEVEEA